MVDKKLALVPIETSPFNAETPMQALSEPLTPSQLFYVRNHFEMPHIDEGTWRLTVDGAVERRLELSLEELQNRPQRTEAVTLECAGNGRTGLVPMPEGTPWNQGAVGTARFTGTPLSLLLSQANPLSNAVEVFFVGADEGDVGGGRIERFARSLPLDVARDPKTLLVWAMNGEPLSREHGFPVRLVLPRWYGIASVKWLANISVLTQPFSGYFQTEQYLYVNERGTPELTPVTLMRVRAVIGRPSDGTEVALGSMEIAGTAWSGSGSIGRVEVSTDEGHSWSEAELGSAPSLHAATPWRFAWDIERPGTYTLIARATDAAGNSQPREPVWNANGYGNNAVHSVRISVAG